MSISSDKQLSFTSAWHRIVTGKLEDGHRHGQWKDMGDYLTRDCLFLSSLPNLECRLLYAI